MQNAIGRGGSRQVCSVANAWQIFRWFLCSFSMSVQRRSISEQNVVSTKTMSSGQGAVGASKCLSEAGGVLDAEPSWATPCGALRPQVDVASSAIDTAQGQPNPMSRMGRRLREHLAQKRLPASVDDGVGASGHELGARLLARGDADDACLHGSPGFYVVLRVADHHHGGAVGSAAQNSLPYDVGSSFRVRSESTVVQRERRQEPRRGELDLRPAPQVARREADLDAAFA